MTQLMTFKEHVLKFVEYQFCWGVVVAFYFFYHHLSLFFQLMLRKSAVEYNVADEVHCPMEMVFHKSGINHRLFLVGVGIQITTHSFHPVEYMPRTAVGGTLKQHVLTEMGNAVFSLTFISRTCVNGHAAVSHIRGRRMVDNADAIF